MKRMTQRAIVVVAALVGLVGCDTQARGRGGGQKCTIEVTVDHFQEVRGQRKLFTGTIVNSSCGRIGETVGFSAPKKGTPRISGGEQLKFEGGWKGERFIITHFIRSGHANGEGCVVEGQVRVTQPLSDNDHIIVKGGLIQKISSGACGPRQGTIIKVSMQMKRRGGSTGVPRNLKLGKGKEFGFRGVCLHRDLWICHWTHACDGVKPDGTPSNYCAFPQGAPQGWVIVDGVQYP